jgi:hypothetical protein
LATKGMAIKPLKVNSPSSGHFQRLYPETVTGGASHHLVGGFLDQKALQKEEPMIVAIWLVIALIQASYRYTYQYKRALHRPHGYKNVKNILHGLELLVLFFVTLIGIDNITLWIIPVIAFALRFFVKFLAFKRESDKLYDLYTSNKIGSSSKARLELSNDEINREIERGERF